MSPVRTCALPRTGPPGDEVLRWQDERITRSEFDARCRSVDVSGGLVDVTALPVPAQLVGIWAAADAGIPVLVGDPVYPLPAALHDPAQLPPQAFLLVATSGTSGAPRAVVRTLESWAASFQAYTALIDLHPGDRVLLTGPLTSTMQLFSAVHALAVGAVVTDDPLRVTSAICVPAALDAVIAAAPGLSTAVVAGARLDEAAARRAQDVGIAVVEYYGAAELSFVAARRWGPNAVPLRPFPGVEVQIRDGEIWSRSAFHALGLSGAAGALRTDPDGFATVGDRGSPAGSVLTGSVLTGTALAGTAPEGTAPEGTALVVHGRGDSAVTVGGRTVLVEDVEAALSDLPGVADAAVSAVPHPRLGQVLVAIIVAAPGADLAEIRGAARRQLRDEWLPRRWRIIEALPRTRHGKIDRAALRVIAAAIP